MIDPRRVPQLWRRLHVTVRDLPLALAFLGASFLPAFQTHGTQLGGLPARPFDGLAVVVIVVECLPLAGRRRWPITCLTLVSLAFASDQLRGYHSLAGTALPIALLSVAAHVKRRRRMVTALVFSAGYVPLAITLWRFGTEPPIEFVTFYFALVLAWGIGSWLRSTRKAETERRRRVAEETRHTERARIARELHDVVTHHVTAMVVQTEAARYLTHSPDRLDQTLTGVTDTGRRAITDLRHLLDVLNPDHGTGTRAPSTGELHDLVEQSRQAGQPVEFTQHGAPAAASGSADLVTHRIVQEALTNALKYAHGARTAVQVRHTESQITVEVTTAGSGERTEFDGRGGRGLAGLRERVGVLGGDFSADGQPDGGFAVRARIPTGKPS